MLEKYRPGMIFDVATAPALKALDFTTRTFYQARYNHKPYLYPLGIAVLLGGSFLTAALAAPLGTIDAALSMATVPFSSNRPRR